jgi:4-hydroxy-tetrahydrodipicolinate reductase
MSLRVGVVGAAGRMGAEVGRAVAAADDLELVAAVDTSAVDTSAVDTSAGSTTAVGGTTAAGPSAGGGPDGRSGPVVVGDLGALAAAGAEIVVDFTVAAASRVTLPWCAAHGMHAVVGTTGLGPDDLDELRRHFPDDGPLGCIVAPNFAIGALLMMRFAELAAPWMDSAEIVELHHDAKTDAPSGTAMGTAARMADARRDHGPWTADPTRTEVVAGARGGVGPGGIRMHSVRLRGLVAHQEVLLGAAGQTLTIRHDSYDRTSFMPGVLLAVRAVAGRPGLTVGLDALLGL